MEGEGRGELLNDWGGGGVSPVKKQLFAIINQNMVVVYCCEMAFKHNCLEITFKVSNFQAAML